MRGVLSWEIPMPAAIDITGQRYERLTALARVGKTTAGGAYVWRCRCDCGKETDVPIPALRNGHTRSCGCLGREISCATAATWSKPKHGMRKSPTHRSWSHMLQRVRNPRNHAFASYGGCGITVC